MNFNQPNILMIMPDQMRGDCLSLEQHPVLSTPNIDSIGVDGIHFRKAYTPCASCIPARRALLTGQSPAESGMIGMYDEHSIKVSTLPQCLRDSGCKTALIGRNMHQWPPEDPYGYECVTEGSTYVKGDDYAQMLERECPDSGGIDGHGLSYNGWTARPWQLPDALHPTTWISNSSQEWLQRNADSKAPLFLTTSFYAPHPPFLPPAHYMQRYLDMKLPERKLGDWAEPPAPGASRNIDSHYTDLKNEDLRRAQAGYFGLINHIDDQIYWLMWKFKCLSRRQGRPWIIVFTSDHGEMLGDHYMFRKCEPYEGSSRIPLLISASDELGFKKGIVCESAVGLADIMPTLLQACDIPVPETVDGKSLLPILRGERQEVRECLHAEHTFCYSAAQAYHMLTDGRHKYIWRPHDGSEQLFCLEDDPDELTDLTERPAMQAALAKWRERMGNRLRGRQEGFVDNGRLIPGQDIRSPLKHCPNGVKL